MEVSKTLSSSDIVELPPKPVSLRELREDMRKCCHDIQRIEQVAALALTVIAKHSLEQVRQSLLHTYVDLKLQLDKELQARGGVEDSGSDSGGSCSDKDIYPE